MNRLEIAVTLMAGYGQENDLTKRKRLIENSFDIADQILKHYNKTTTPPETYQSKHDSVITNLLIDKLDWDEPVFSWRWEQASVVLKECGYKNPNNCDSSKAGVFIRARNSDTYKRVNGRKLLHCPHVG